MGSVKAALFLALIVATAAYAARGQENSVKGEESKSGHVSHLMSEEEIDRLLVKPPCLKSFNSDGDWGGMQDFPVSSMGSILAAKLYLPNGEGPWPAVILVPGGFNETELALETPRYEAPRFAGCGIATVVYYKRGTGKSGGSYADATYDDFIDDVGNIARQLAQHPKIDPARIGAQGGSSGGLVASIAAARYPEIAFAVNRSGPIVTFAEENDYNIDYALRVRGYADSLVDEVLPLWKRHHAAWDAADTAALMEVAAEIIQKRENHDPFLFPTPYDEVFEDSNLVFLWPVFRSSSRDYLSELKSMRKPWLSIYGEEDPIVPVDSCVRRIEQLMNLSGNDKYSIIVLKDVGHSFIDADSGRQIPTIRIVLNWLMEDLGGE